MLKVEGLCKTYPRFELKDISFELPVGYIMGFIGVNGAGKSTTLKCMLNIAHRDAGKVTVFDNDIDNAELEIKQDVGFSLGAFDYYPKYKIKNITAAYAPFYKNWNKEAYDFYLKKFHIDEQKRISELSQGMRVKYSLALALSHGAKLFVFDEPTSGLDPISRDEILEIFQQLVEKGERSILFSTHITSDLDKCADFIVFIKNGRLIANSTKDGLIADHALISGKKAALTDNLKARVIAVKTNSLGFKGLILRENLLPTDDVAVETPNLEDIMVYYNKEEENEGIFE